MKTSITLKDVLLEEAKITYTITKKLFNRVAENELSWRPTTGKNWMSVGQLLMHCSNFGCGKAIQGFVTGNWGFPDNLDNDQHVPPAEKLPCVESVKQALRLLEEDRNLTLNCISEVNETELLTKRIIAPWGGPEQSLFQHLQLMIDHLVQHKGQLFYYLKLMGKNVNSIDLWGE